MKTALVLVLLVFGLSSMAGEAFYCDNSTGHSITIDGEGNADITTPYESVRFSHVVKGGSHYFSSQIVQGGGIRSFSLKRKGDNSSLRIWRKKPIVQMDEQQMSCD